MNAILPMRVRRVAFDVAILVAFVVACYGLRLDKLSVRGEESRWATVAMEMRRTGDWVVPRQQGEPFLSRPPLGSWLIAAMAFVRGEFDPIAVRLPSILAVLATSLLIYGYGQSFLGGIGALTAAVGFAAMPEVLQMGRLAESDAVFTLFLGGSLVVWHWGHSRNWPSVMTWGVAYLLSACGTLTKGPQAPVYFAATVGLYLVSTGQWRQLVTPAHLVGLGIYVATVGAWLAPFAWELGLAKAWAILTGDSTDRFVNLSLWAVLKHMAVYPFEILGCTAPWSWLLIAFASRRFRSSLADAGPHARFLVLALAVSFPICWVTPGGQTRYLMPLYPCVALLAGIVIDRLAAPSPGLRLAMRGMRNVTTVMMVGVTATIIWLTWFSDDPTLRHWKQPVWFASLFAIGSLVAVVTWMIEPRAVLAVGAVIGAFYAGAVVNQLDSMSEHAAEKIAELKSEVPAGAEMASLGPVHHKFAYEWGRAIDLLNERATPGEWFSYTSIAGQRRRFEFACEEVVAISMDRHHFEKPQIETIIMHRTRSNDSWHVVHRHP